MEGLQRWSSLKSSMGCVVSPVCSYSRNYIVGSHPGCRTGSGHNRDELVSAKKVQRS